MHKNVSITVTALLFLITVISGLKLVAQNPQEHPRVGLALAGGSALGLAHIGVLKYFDEHHIPIDYLAGTSMGGLVGGFYATGIDPQELQKIVEGAAWDELLSPNYRFDDEPIVEKQEWNRQSGWITLRFGRRFAFPAGINSGQAVALLLSRHTQAYSNLKSFDELPTPFRCVATDLVSGSSVVLDHGSLPKALRATMALPGIFTPVNWEGKVLIDGGLTNNLPSDVVRDMGATKVIGVTLEGPPATAKQFTSLTTVLRQSASIAVVQNERQGAARADLVIHVRISGINSSDYEQAKKLIQQGYAAAQSMGKELSEYELAPAEWKAYKLKRQSRVRKAPAQGPLVAVVSTQTGIEQNAHEELYRKLGHGPVDEKDLEDVVSGVVAATSLPGAYFEWLDQPGLPQGYRVEFLERPDQIVLIRPSVTFNISNGEPTRGALNVGVSVVPLDTYKSRYIGEFNAGYDPGLRAEYYHPFGGSAYLIAAGLQIQRLHNLVYDGPTRNSFVRDRFAGSFYGGLGTWRFVQFRAGLRGGYDSDSKSVTLDGVTSNSGPFVNPEAMLTYDSQDSGAIPSRGTRMDAAAGYSYRAHSFPYIQDRFSSFYPVTKPVSVFLKGEAEISLGRNLGFFDRFTAGGEQSLPAFRYQEFRANTIVNAGAGAIFRGPAIKSLSTNVNFAAWHEIARLDLGSQGWQTRQSATIGLFFPTPVGALGTMVAFTEQGKARFRLTLGSF